MSATKRILVIGGDGPNCQTDEYLIRSVPWHRISDVKNVRDYHFVIVNLLDRPSTADSHIWTPFVALFRAAIPAFAAHCRVLIIGDPRFDIDLTIAGVAPGCVTFLAWAEAPAGERFCWDSAPGDGIREGQEATPGDRHYLSLIRRYAYTLRQAPVGGDVLLYSLDGSGIAFRLFEEPLQGLTFYPGIDRPADETTRIALKAFCDVDVGPEAEPPWATALVAPGQAAIDRDFAAARVEREEIDARIAALEQTRAARRSVLRLLYEQGPPLEAEVRSMLARLGAQVREPTEPGQEDAWIAVSLDAAVREGVVEIKGTTRDHFNEGGLRQLVDWVFRGSTCGKDYAGIFIGASAVNKPPDSRADPFSDSWRRSAERFGLIALTTIDLYRAFEMVEAGQITRADFWRSVFATKGIYDLSRLRPQPTAPTAGH